MHSFVLQDITAGLQYRSLYNWKNISVSGIGYDSGKIKPGNVFVAVKGLKHDGHRFIPEAVGKGAAVIVAEEKPSAPYSVIWIQVPDSRLALSLLAANFYGQPSQHFSLIGVTGTCGKTTTTSLLREIYETAGLISGMIGTVEVHCARQTWLSRLTTPDSLELQRYLYLMVESGVSHAAMEVSSHGLALKRVDGISFQGAIFTNISPNHLDFHENIEDYAAAKGRLASLVKPEGFLLVNKDDSYLQKLSFSINSKCFYFGTHPSCDFFIQDTILEEQGSSFVLKVQNKNIMESLALEAAYSLHIPLLGMHNVYELNQVLPEEEDAFFSGVIASGLTPRHYPELDDAIRQALEAAVPESTLILLGAQGMDEGVKILQEQLSPHITLCQ